MLERLFQKSGTSVGSFLLVGTVILSLSLQQKLQGGSHNDHYSWKYTTLEKQVWNAGDLDLYEVEKSLVREIQKDPHSAQYYGLLAFVYIRIFSLNSSRVDLIKKAIDLSSHAIDLAPDREHGYLAKAIVYEGLGKGGSASRVLANIPKHVQRTWRTEFAQARLKTNLSSKIENFNNLLAIAKKHPESADTIGLFLDIITKAETNHAVKERMLRRCILSLKIDRCRMGLANHYVDVGEGLKAEQIYKKLYKSLQARGLKTEILKINKAVNYYQNLNKHYAALKLLRSINPRDLRGHGPRVKHALQLHLASALILNGRLQEAKNEAIESLHFDHLYNKEFSRHLLTQYERTKNLNQYVEVLLQAAKDSHGLKNKPGLFHLAGLILSNQLGQHKRAIAELKKAMILDHRSLIIINDLGLAMYRKGDLLSALKAFNRSLQIDENFPAANYNKACILSLLGRKKEAIAFLERALFLDPSLHSHAVVDIDFKNLRNHPQFKSLISRLGSSRNYE